MNKILCAISIIILVSACDGNRSNPAGILESFDFQPNPVMVKEQPVITLPVGSKAPDFNLPGVDGKYHTLSDYEAAEVLVILFTCNHCPTAQAYEDRIIAIHEDYKSRNVALIAISPNSPLGLMYEELGYSDLGDTFEDMITRARIRPFKFPYLYDGDDQRVSLAYGPIATPHVFVFDKNRILKYVGRIDASEKPGTGNGEDLRNAIEQTLVGKDIAEGTTKTFGCSTKWGWKTKLRTKIDQEWEEKEVNLLTATLPQIEEVVKNESEKLRLINVWATWCAPCRLEYPEFIVIQRMFGARDFEFISISADKLGQEKKVHDFLSKSHSAVTNYISETDDKYALIEAVDAKWNGALPYTALIEPGGNVVWSHQGEVDFLELKRRIVDHEMIGRVY